MLAKFQKQLGYFAIAVGALANTTTSAEPLLQFCDDFSKPAHSQRDPYEERIETERHDFTQSAVTVGRRVAQVESGYTYFFKDHNAEIESAHTGRELMRRYGLTEDIEFRVRWNNVWQFTDAGEQEYGSEDLRYAIKLHLTRPEQSSLIPTSALEVRGTAPSGGEAYSTGKVEFGLDYIYQWNLTEGKTIAGSTGFGTDGLGDFGIIPDEPSTDRFIAYSQSFVYGMELSEMNTIYAEWYGILSDGLEDEFVTSYFNIGIDHYLTDNFVIDIRAGVGLSEDSDDMFFGVGGGYRF